MNVRIPRKLIDRPIEYDEREELKRPAYRALAMLPQDATSARIRNAMILLAMCYQRNRTMCPDFEVYAAHFLTAQGRAGLDQHFGDQAAQSLLKRFGTVENCYILPGGSDFQKRLKPR